MAQVSDLINEAFLDISAIAAGQTITAEELSDAFMRLNQMLDSWSNEQVSVFTEQHQSFVLTAGTASYTMGPSGALSTAARPVKVLGASSVSGAFRQPVKVISFGTFDRMIENPLGVTSVLAQAIATDNSFPLINVKVFPTPASSPGNLEIDYWTPLAQFVSTTDVVSLPPGFEDALHFNLAVRIAPQYGKQPNALLMANAQMTKQAITEVNASILDLAPAETDTQAPAPKGNSNQ